MVKNMGTVDRVVRIGFALIVAVLYVAGLITGWLALILGVLALVFLVTGIVGFCPLYLPFNFSTRR